MSRPTTGGTLLKPSNLTHTQTFRKRKGQERERASARAKDTRAPFFFSIYILLESMIQAVRQLHEWVIPMLDQLGAQTTRPPTACWHNVTVSVPVQVKGSDLCVVPFKVGEVEEVYVRLCISGLSAQRETDLNTNTQGCMLTCWKKKKKEVASGCDLAVGITELEQQKRRHWSGISVFLVTVVVLLHGFQQSLSVVWEWHE